MACRKMQWNEVREMPAKESKEGEKEIKEDNRFRVPFGEA